MPPSQDLTCPILCATSSRFRPLLTSVPVVNAASCSHARHLQSPSCNAPAMQLLVSHAIVRVCPPSDVIMHLPRIAMHWSICHFNTRMCPLPSCKLPACKPALVVPGPDLHRFSPTHQTSAQTVLAVYPHCFPPMSVVHAFVPFSRLMLISLFRLHLPFNRLAVFFLHATHLLCFLADSACLCTLPLLIGLALI